MAAYINRPIMNYEALLNLEQFSIFQFTGLALRFIFNLAIAVGLVLLVYRKNSSNKGFCFTLISFNLIIFALCTILNNVDLSIGSGFGLFAVFTMMRYRSEQLQIKDMTYLLILIGLGFVNATFSSTIGPFEIVFLNIAISLSLLLLEKTMFNHKLVRQKIKYDQLDLLRLENRTLLKKDLEKKLGARVENIQIDSINFVEGSSNIVVRYNPYIEVHTTSYLKKEEKEEPEIIHKKDPVMMNGT